MPNLALMERPLLRREWMAPCAFGMRPPANRYAAYRYIPTRCARWRSVQTAPASLLPAKTAQRGYGRWLRAANSLNLCMTVVGCYPPNSARMGAGLSLQVQRTIRQGMAQRVYGMQIQENGW